VARLTDEEAIALIEKLRRAQPNNRELWRAFDDYEMRIYSRPVEAIVAKPVKAAKEPCLACAKRKANKAASMKKWRDKNPKPKHDRYAG
jgi:hypothetical protein